jgi:hypothetical protein
MTVPFFLNCRFTFRAAYKFENPQSEFASLLTVYFLSLGLFPGFVYLFSWTLSAPVA